MNTSRLSELTSFITTKLKSSYPDINFNLVVSENNGYKFSIKLDGIDSSMAHVADDDNTFMSRRYGFTQNIVGLEFKFSRKNVRPATYMVVGFKPSSRKYSIETIDVNTKKTWFFTPDCIRTAFGGNVALNREIHISNLLNE